MLTQEQFSTLLVPVINHYFDMGLQSVPSIREQLFNVQTSKIANEVGVGIGGMSTDVWSMYKDTGKKGELDFDQLYSQNYTHQEYPVELIVRKNLAINDQYGIINKKFSRAGLSAGIKMEEDATSLLNNAFSASFKFSDGVALCSASHPRGPNTTGTYSNLNTVALTEQSLSDARVQLMNVKDDRGNKIGLMPNELWVPPELQDTALKVTQSVQEAASANNAINPQAGRWTVKVMMRATDTNNWFITDSMWRQQVCNWYERESFQIMLVRENTTELVYEMKMHYSYGVDDWRFIYGQNVP